MYTEIINGLNTLFPNFNYLGKAKIKDKKIVLNEFIGAWHDNKGDYYFFLPISIQPSKNKHKQGYLLNVKFELYVYTQCDNTDELPLYMIANMPTKFRIGNIDYADVKRGTGLVCSINIDIENNCNDTILNCGCC